MNFKGKLDKTYWIFIYAAVFFHMVAAILTVYLLQENLGIECVNASIVAFDAIGCYWWMIATSIWLIGIMVFIPYFMEENEHVGLWSIAFLAIIVFIMAFDALNDISVVMKIYWLNDFIITMFRTPYNAASISNTSVIGFKC